MQIPLGQYAYRRADGLLPEVQLRDVFFEKTPTNLKDRSALLTRPTLTPYVAAGTGPCRGFFREEGAFGGDAFTVSGMILYRFGDSGTPTVVGAVPGTGPVEMAFGTAQAIICSDGALLQTNGVTVTAMAFPDSLPIRSVGYINGYFLAVPVDSHRIYFTDLLTGLFEGTRFVSAERYPDDVEKIIVTSDEMWAMGKASTEVFVPTGIDTSDQPPFQRVEGRLYKKGCYSRTTAVKADNTIFWVGVAEDGGLALYRGDAVPVVVSDPSFAERMKAANVEDMRAWVLGAPGHSFYILGLGAQGTWAFDIAGGTPYEWGSYERPQFRAHLGRGVWNGLALAGDDETGQIWLLDDTGVDDGGAPLTQIVTGGAPVTGRPSNANVALDCAVGQVAMGEAAAIRMEYSDDQGRTWCDEGLCSLAVTGGYDGRVRWERLGTMVPPARVFRWTTTSRVRLRIDAARINEPF